MKKKTQENIFLFHEVTFCHNINNFFIFSTLKQLGVNFWDELTSRRIINDNNVVPEEIIEE